MNGNAFSNRLRNLEKRLPASSEASIDRSLCSSAEVALLERLDLQVQAFGAKQAFAALSDDDLRAVQAMQIRQQPDAERSVYERWVSSEYLQGFKYDDPGAAARWNAFATAAHMKGRTK